MVVDLLNETWFRLDRGDLPDTALERERELYDELGALRYQRDRLLETPNAEAAQLEPLVRRMAAIENELSLLAMAGSNERRAWVERRGSRTVALRTFRRRWTTAPCCCSTR